MNSELKMKVTIETQNNSEKYSIGCSIHEQLVGNQDYIDNNIVLNIDSDNTILIYIFKECENVPDIIVSYLKGI